MSGQDCGNDKDLWPPIVFVAILTIAALAFLLGRCSA